MYDIEKASRLVKGCKNSTVNTQTPFAWICQGLHYYYLCCGELRCSYCFYYSYGF